MKVDTVLKSEKNNSEEDRAGHNKYGGFKWNLSFISFDSVPSLYT